MRATIGTAHRSSIGRRLAGAALVAVVSLAFGLASIEAVLRLAPGVVGARFANAVFSTYHDDPGGIYFRDRETRMNFMRPELATRGYWNGHAWLHRTDADGFRNPPGTASDGLLLFGDSMIYGHGVEEEETVAHFLRSEHGRAAYSMARQGDTLFQEYVLARLALARLRPEQLLLFVFLNDFEDMTAYRKPEQITGAPEIDHLDYAALAARVRDPEADGLRKQYRRLRVWRLYEGLRKAPPAPTAAPDPDALHPSLVAILDDARFAPVADYYRRVLGDLAARTRAQGIELSIVLLDLGDEVIPKAIPAQDRLHALLAEIGRENEFRVLSTRSIYAGCPECFLPGDGHLTREGHRRLAEFVHREVPRPAAH
jgi:hypothetical protein